MDKGELGLLDEVASFSSCTRSELDLLSFIGNELLVGAGTEVMSENAVSRECLVVVGGRARVTRCGETIGTLGPGEFVGELSLLAGATHPVTVTAATPMEFLVLSPAEFDSLLAHAPSVVRKMLRHKRSA